MMMPALIKENKRMTIYILNHKIFEKIFTLPWKKHENLTLPKGTSAMDIDKDGGHLIATPKNFCLGVILT